MYKLIIFGAIIVGLGWVAYGIYVLIENKKEKNLPTPGFRDSGYQRLVNCWLWAATGCFCWIRCWEKRVAGNDRP